MTRITQIGLLLAVLATGLLSASGRSASTTTTAHRTPVLVELFTSEGCSDCPPADALLRRLVADQPIEGVEIVGLGDHVDYWDRLGWRDPFSAAVFSERQSQYEASVFRSNEVYTPQIVVDGFLESVGSDEATVTRNIRSAAKQPKATLTLAVTQTTGANVSVNLRAWVPPQIERTGQADLVVAVTEDGLTTHVERGENHGRTLSHSAVVRTVTPVGGISAGDRTASTNAVLRLAKEWNQSHIRLVAFVQEQASRRILGTSAVMLAPVVLPELR
jgi:hypothetical protein